MSERKKGFRDAILEQGSRLVTRAAKAVADDPRGREVVATAVGVAQRSKHRVEAIQLQVMRAAGLATKGDYDEVARSMARMKRKLRSLAKQVDEERKR
jgi:cell fate regulator YaaT (PSP1 superfamily)